MFQTDFWLQAQKNSFLFPVCNILYRFLYGYPFPQPQRYTSIGKIRLPVQKKSPPTLFPGWTDLLLLNDCSCQ